MEPTSLTAHVGRPIVVISPHYDDAVFSCGHLLSLVPNSTVVTVFTALPANSNMLTDWDRRCGFTDATQAMHARHTENQEALSVLQATGIELDFLDDQYPQTPQCRAELLIDALAVALMQLQPSTVIFPLGLFHSDHICVSDALITLSPRFDTTCWIAYEDIPYSRQPAWVKTRVAQLAQLHILATPVSIEPSATVTGQTHLKKQRAVNAYKSQFLGLGYANAQPIMRQPERYWQIHANMDL